MKLWIYRIFLIVCICSVVGFILFNSTRTGEQSSSISNSVIDKVVDVVAPEISEMETEQREKAMYNANAFLRDVAHVAEYIALAGLAALLFFTLKFNYGRYAIPTVLVCLSCFVFALCDELLQNSFSGRMAQITDVAMDMLGSAIGVVGACAVDFIGICVINRRS